MSLLFPEPEIKKQTEPQWFYDYCGNCTSCGKEMYKIYNAPKYSTPKPKIVVNCLDCKTKTLELKFLKMVER